jgi:hypothetical protein
MATGRVWGKMSDVPFASEAEAVDAIRKSWELGESTLIELNSGWLFIRDTAYEADVFQIIPAYAEIEGMSTFPKRETELGAQIPSTFIDESMPSSDHGV